MIVTPGHCGRSRDASKIMKDLFLPRHSFPFSDLVASSWDAEVKTSKNERRKMILEIQSLFMERQEFYWACEDSPWRPNLMDHLERFFNTSISHFILFWNRIENCHNSVNSGLSRQISLSSTQSLWAWWGLNTTTSRLIGGCEANLIWLASQESVKKWPHNWCLLICLTFLQNVVKLILASRLIRDSHTMV